VKPDAVACWPRNCDYPLWRRFVRDERERFGEVIVVFTEHDGHDYRDFVRGALPEAACLDSPPRGERDWRDVAVNAALDRSASDWVWFTEQDLLIGDRDAFFALDGPRGFWDHYRWHPASLLLPRDAVEATSRYFGPVPLDHFARFSAELAIEVQPVPRELFSHLQGVSQNHWLYERYRSLDAPGIFAPQRWLDYLAASLGAGVPLDGRWARLAREALGRDAAGT